MSDPGLGPYARQDIRAALARFGISTANRAVGTDPTEEVILLHAQDFEHIDTHEVTAAIKDVLPDTKVWVIQEHPEWEAEPL